MSINGHYLLVRSMARWKIIFHCKFDVPVLKFMLIKFDINTRHFCSHVCGTLKCENAAICEKVAKCEKNSTLNVKIDAICEKMTLNVKK